MAFDTSKNLSGIGALLIVVGGLSSVVPYVGILTLVGVILLLIGLKGLASFYKEDGIFNNSLYAIIASIVGVVVAFATIVISAVATLASIGIDLNNIEDWANIGTEFGNYFADFGNFSELTTLIGAVIISLVILFVFAIIAMIFFRKTLTELASKSGVGLFATAGLIMLIAVLFRLSSTLHLLA